MKTDLEFLTKLKIKGSVRIEKAENTFVIYKLHGRSDSAGEESVVLEPRFLSVFVGGPLYYSKVL